MIRRPHLHEVEWRLLGELFSARFGLVFDGIRKDFLEGRLAPRLGALHLDSFTDYYHYLLYHPEREAELGQLGVLLTNNETYFFRETHQFDLITRHVVPTVPASRPLRLLSAGCSSGEEAYSLVIALQNAGLELGGHTWQIDACDLNPRRLAQAREGSYDTNSLRACDDAARQRYFTAQADRFVLRPRYRAGIRFFEANLVDPAAGYGWGPYDAVLCRNVLIYFSESAFESVIALFARCLAPRGFLFLGHSESLLDKRTAFTPVCLDGSVIYRKSVGL